jgi:hypothetical protein
MIQPKRLARSPLPHSRSSRSRPLVSVTLPSGGDCTWAATEYRPMRDICPQLSMKPGTRVLPARSTTSVPSLFQRARMSLLLPTAMILLPLMATAWAVGRLSSRVSTSPLVKMMSESGGGGGAGGGALGSTGTTPAAGGVAPGAAAGEATGDGGCHGRCGHGRHGWLGGGCRGGNRADRGLWLGLRLGQQGRCGEGQADGEARAAENEGGFHGQGSGYHRGRQADAGGESVEHSIGSGRRP